jgi:thioredoxin-dependent peroxiredoxin
MKRFTSITLLLMFYFGNGHAQLKVGDKVPSFQLQDQHGKVFDSHSVLGKQPLVIYFYPKDETRTCTAEACSFRDNFEAFTQKGVLVIGISADDVASHKKFAEHHRLPFTLLADTKNEVRKLFGVPKKLFIPGRVTYIVDKQGVIIHTFNSFMDGEKHVTEALQALDNV